MELFILILVGVLFTIPLLVLIPIFKILAPIYAYSYPNARLRAMRSKLVSDEQLIDFTHKEYMDIVYALEKGDFENFKRIIGPDTSFSTVESAFRAHMITTLSKIKAMSPAQSQQFIDAYLERYDVEVIKSIVRSQQIDDGLDHDLLNVTSHFSNEFITRDKISVVDLQNELKGSSYGVLISKFKDQITQGKYVEFEKELDQLFFTRLLNRTSSLEARHFVKRTIDLNNISLALKGLQPHLPNGRIPLEKFENNLQLSKIQSLLKEYGYNVESTTPQFIERDLQRSFKKMGEGYLTQNPLSENSIIGFMITKAVNVRNILTILKLTSHGADSTKIKEVLAI